MFAALLFLLSAQLETVDYAALAQRDAWLRHPVYGDASFDAFERLPGNPIVRGAAPYEWPVNGFLLQDPKNGNWYAYVGRYCTNYAFKDDAPSICTVYRSTDAGLHWSEVGPAIAGDGFLFDGETSPLFHAPDVCVLYAEGRYHMVFDWCTKNTTWTNAAAPPPDANSGVGYAWSDTPEGPFHPVARPVATTRDQTLLENRYRRLYASSLHRRANDWLVLTLTDSGPYFGWALTGMTAPKPEGPYTKPVLLLHPGQARFHPPLMEFFPSFVHGEFLYAPATSVAANRNFQTLFRVPIERALEPDAWEIDSYGSVWHAEPVAHEAHGIWGQTFSASFDTRDIMTVLFPSRDKDGLGTINLAQRPWNRPYREQGFVISGHEAPSFVRLKRGGAMTRLEIRAAIQGELRVVPSANGPLGPEKPRSGAVVSALAWDGAQALSLTPSHWKVLRGSETLAEGDFPSAPKVEAGLAWTGAVARLSINGAPVWEGAWDTAAGSPALWAPSGGWARVEQFAVSGEQRPASIAYLCTEALLGAAQQEADWRYEHTPEFKYGWGAVSVKNGVEGKWNFEGSACTLWAPRGPQYGKAEILLDGITQGIVDFSAPASQSSSAVFSVKGLRSVFHALHVRVKEGAIPLDALEAEE